MSKLSFNDNEERAHSMGDDLSHLLSRDTRPRGGRAVAIMEVDATEQVKIDLGVYGSDNPPKGFTVDYEPEVEPKTAIVSKLVVARTNKTGMYELVLFFTNFSDRTVTVTVWEH